MIREIDKVLVSILQRRLKSVTQEMSIALAMTTRSPILCEAKDFCYRAVRRGRQNARADGEPAYPLLFARACVRVYYQLLW